MVFLAEDLGHRRPVAIKVLRPELSAALGTERFLREIEVVARRDCHQGWDPDLVGISSGSRAVLAIGQARGRRFDFRCSLAYSQTCDAPQEAGDDQP